MPELPEAEASRRLIEQHCRGKTVSSIKCIEQGGGPRSGLFDDKVIDEAVTETSLQTALVGKTVKAVHRKGKQIWIELTGPGKVPGLSLLFHHGMTGHLRIKGTSSVKYARDVAKETETWPPKFTKIEIGFGGTKLSFADPRRLGKVRLREDATGVPPISNLATDPITEIIDPVALSVTLATVAAPIKAVLLDQQRVVCGIGNWLADDILYEAKIHPEMRPASMNRDDFVALADAITFVCAEACRVNADSSQFPPHWLFHMRWKNPRGQSTLDDGRVIQQSTVGGRATYHVIAEQQKSGRGGAGAGAEAGGAGAGARSGGARPAPKIEAPKAKRKVHKDKGKAATVKTESGAAKAVATIPSKRRKVSAVKSRALEVGANLTRRTRTARRSTEEAAGAGRTRSTSRGKK